MRSLQFSRRVALLAAAATFLLLVLAAAPAYATGGGHLAAPDASIISTLTSPITSVFSAIGGAVLGAFSWTISLASKFILITLGALVKMLIPRSWAKDAIGLFQWIVAIPDYAGTVTSPGGGHVYGFAGVNDLRELFQWLGIGLLPLTLVYATSRAMLGRGDHIAAPLARVVVLAALLASYPYWWEQAAALVNQLTHMILSPAVVVVGIHKLMAYAVDGVALGGWQLVDLGLMAALAVELLTLIFAKVVLILLGALLFATGPLTIGLVPTESGDVIARAWMSAVVTLLMLPVAWAAVFAVGAVLVDDASSAGPLIGGQAQIGSLLGGVIVAVAGAATLWLCLKAAREVGGLLRLQIGGLLVIAGRGRSGATSGPAAAGTHPRVAAAASSIRGFQGKVRAASAAALDAAGPRTGAVARAAGTVGRRGLLAGSLTGAGSAALAAGRLAGRSSAGTAARPHLGAAAASAAIATAAPNSRLGRAGAVASRMARAGSAAWQQNASPAARGTDTGGAAGSQRRGAGEAAPAAASAPHSRGAAGSVGSSSGAGSPPSPRSGGVVRSAGSAPANAGGTDASRSGDRAPEGQTVARQAPATAPTPRSRTSSNSSSASDPPARPAGPPPAERPVQQPASPPAERPRPGTGPRVPPAGRD
jgi:hypothetical protein